MATQLVATKLRSAPSIRPVTCQQPAAGILTPTSMADPMSDANALVADEATNGPADPSIRRPVTVSGGCGSPRQSYPWRHQKTFWP